MAETAETPNTGKNNATPFTSLSALVDVHSHLLQREPADEERPKYFEEVEEFLHNAQATGAILDTAEERYTAQSILNYWITVLYRNVVEVENAVPVESAALADYNPSLNLKMEDAQCPYPGVRAFREDENKLFFGRQRQINYLLSRLREDRLLAVVGPSGSGKTSIVLAGLLPEMNQADKASNTQRQYFPVISPGKRPLDSLNRLLQGSSDVASAHSNAMQTDGFHRDTFHLLKRIEEATRLPAVIVIDEFDEVFTRSNESDRHDFIANLARVIQAPDAKHIVILTMRDDNYDSYLRRPERFRKALDPAKVSLPQLSSIDLRDAIEKPAAYVRLKFEESTIKALVKETISEPVGLPLLQFTLWKLWTRKNQEDDINVAFDHMKSCRKALADSAEEFFRKLDFLDQRSCSRLLSKLIKLDGDLRAYSYPAARSELHRTAETKARVDSLIKRLSEAQLIRLCKRPVSADDQVELVHDSLIRTWPRMASWVAKKRNARWWSRIAASVLVVALMFLLAFLLALKWGQKKQGDQALALAEISDQQFKNERLDLALLFARNAYELEPNVTTESNVLKLLGALQSTSHPKMFLYEKNFEAEDMAFSAEPAGDPTRIAAVDDNGNVLIWNMTSREIEQKLAVGSATYPLAFSPDGKTLATASKDADVALILWDLEKGEQKKHGRQTAAFPLTSMAFSHDGKTLITGSVAGTVIGWDLSSDEIKGTPLYPHSSTVNAIAFSANDQWLAIGSEDGTVILSDQTAKRKNRKTLAGRGGVKRIVSLAFNKQDDQLAAGSLGEVFIWDIATGSRITEFTTCSTRAPILVSFRDDDQFLTAFSFDGSLISLDLISGEMKDNEFYKPTATRSATFSNNGELLALPGDDGVVVLDVVSPSILMAGSRVPVAGVVKSIAFSPGPDNQVMTAREDDGSLTEWKIPSAERLRVDNGVHIESYVSSLAFAENGGLMALGLENGTISLRDVKGNKQIKGLDPQTGTLVKEGILDPVQESDVTAADYEALAAPLISKIVFDPQPGSSRLAAVVKLRNGNTEIAPADDNYLGTKIILWDTSQPTSTPVPTEEDSFVTSLAFSPDGQILAWGSAPSDPAAKPNFKVLLWDGHQREALACREKGSGDAQVLCEARVASLAFDRHMHILAAGLDNGKILLWDTTTRKRVGGPLEGSAGQVTDLAFGLDGTILAAVTNRQLRYPPPGVITLWDVATRTRIGSPLRGHNKRVSAIAFSADGKMLASGSDSVGGQIILWDLDIKNAGNRFCGIVGCQHERSEVADQLKNTSWFQKFYRSWSSWCPEVICNSIWL